MQATKAKQKLCYTSNELAEMIGKLMKEERAAIRATIEPFIQKQILDGRNKVIEGHLIKIAEALLSSAQSYKALVGRQDGWITRIDTLQRQQTAIDEAVAAMQKLVDSIDAQTKTMSDFLKKLSSYAPDYVK